MVAFTDTTLPVSIVINGKQLITGDAVQRAGQIASNLLEDAERRVGETSEDEKDIEALATAIAFALAAIACICTFAKQELAQKSVHALFTTFTKMVIDLAIKCNNDPR